MSHGPFMDKEDSLVSGGTKMSYTHYMTVIFQGDEDHTIHILIPNI